MSAQHRFDVLILGSGAAGLATALALPEHLSVALLSKGPLAAGATSWAQGGIAAVLDGDLDVFMEGYLRWRRST